MSRALASLVLLAGCDSVFDFNGERLDAGVDASPDAFEPVCLGKQGPGRAGLLEVCLDTPPLDTRDLPATLDSGTAGTCTTLLAQTDALHTEVCLVIARNLVVGTALELRGPYPIALVALDTLTISAELSAASRRDTLATGPGTPFLGCAFTGRNGTNGATSTGGGGGAGGAFGGIGGNGGSSGSAAGGDQAPAVTLGFVRAGCPGGRGGDGAGSNANNGNSGAAGGGLYLIAGNEISVTATINASGMGGTGGGRGLLTDFGGGGGGGGSGGLIGLDAPRVRLGSTARLVANGGGGGGGGGTGAGSSHGTDGHDPDLGTTSAPPFDAAGGGPGLPGGNAGGGGAAVGVAAVSGLNASGGGGGGGGGGVGHIAIFAAEIIDDGAVFSPAHAP